jgi:hypothetical protein
LTVAEQRGSAAAVDPAQFVTSGGGRSTRTGSAGRSGIYERRRCMADDECGRVSTTALLTVKVLRSLLKPLDPESVVMVDGHGCREQSAALITRFGVYEKPRPVVK